MKLGIQNSAYFVKGTKNTDYAKMHAHGYGFADFQNLMDINSELYKMDGVQFAKVLTEEKQKANSCGIEFSQVHAPWPTDDKTPESRAKALDFMKRAVEGTALIDGKFLVVHPAMPDWSHEDDPDETEKINEERFYPLLEFAKDYPVGICIENMPMTALRLSKTERIADFVRRSGFDNFFICLDTGHVNVFHEDCGEAVRLCGDKLKTLHIHDNFGESDRHTFPFTGSVNWDSFTSALKDINFGGVFSLECAPSVKYPDKIREQLLIALAETAEYLAGKCR